MYESVLRHAKRFVYLLIFVFLSTPVYSKNYYVAISGKNSNSGTIQHPFRTIQFGVNHLKPGDRCIVREGVYREKVVFRKSGKKDLPIRLLNYQNEQVTIAPALVTQKWKRWKKNIYRVPCSGKVLQLFIDGKPSMQASYPDIIEGDMNVKSWGDMQAFPDKTVLLKGLSKFSHLEGCHFLGLSNRGIVAISGNIINHRKNTITLKNDEFYWDQKFIDNYLGNGKGFITGKLQLLDSPGEWFHDGKYLYYWPLKTISKTEICIRKFENQLKLKNLEYINITGINLFGVSLLLNSKNCSIKNCKILYPTPFFKSTSGFNSKEGLGVKISGEKNIIKNSYIAHSWGNGIMIAGRKNTVQNCIVYDCDWMAIDCAPLLLLGKNHKILNSSFSNTARSGILFGVLEKCKIKYNEIKESGLMCDDLGLIYCYYNDGKNTEIAYNWLHDNHAPFYGAGIYLDNGHKNFKVHHNVVWNCFIGMTINEPCENDIIAHNTFFQNKYSMSCWPPRPTGNVNIKTYNNITDTDLKAAWHQDYHGSIKDSNHVTTNIYSILQNPTEKDFQLRANAYPIDKGINYYNSKSHEGKAPDLGAYEYGKPKWIPGANLKITNLLYEPSPDSEFETVEQNPWVEYSYTFLWFALLVYILKKWKFIQSTGIKTQTIYLLFGVKVLFGFALFWVYNYYYLNTNTADIFKYFEDAKVLKHYIYNDSPIDYLKFIFGFHIDTPATQEAILHTKHWVKLVEINALNDNQTIIRIHALLLFITNGYFHIHTLIFCFISFIGCIFLFKTIKALFPLENGKIIIGLFLIPSVLFWSSGVLKESILIFGIGLFVYHWWKVIYKQGKYLLSIPLIIGSLYLIMILKSYVIIAMLPSIISWYLIHRTKTKFYLPIFLIINAAYVIFLFKSHDFLPSFNFMEHLMFKQNDFINVATEMHAQSKIELPILDGTYSSLLTNIPNAIYNVFCQPEMSRITNALMLFSFLENLFIISLIGVMIFFFKKPSKEQRLFIWFCFFYILLLSILIGLVVPISGAIVRYKIPFIPFLVVSVLICIDFEKIKNIFKKM